MMSPRHRRARAFWVLPSAIVLAVAASLVAFANMPSDNDSAPDQSIMLLDGNANDMQAPTQATNHVGNGKIDPNNDPRIEDFAVDPSRTDWNFESNGEKVVYLTIDDGPSGNTQQILDTLDRYNAKATFFVTNINPDYSYMIKESFERGHTIGLHAYSHDYSTMYASETAYFNDLDAIGKVVEEQIGFVPCFVRFPGGSSNTISSNYCPGIMNSLVKDVPARGYQYYDWNVSTGDGSSGLTVDDVVNNACDPANLQYDNIIMLLHDSTAKTSSTEALPQIIEFYQAQGYTFKAIDRTSVVVQHR